MTNQLATSSSCVIVRVREFLKRTVVGDWRFDNLSISLLQSQVNSACQSMVLYVCSVKSDWSVKPWSYWLNFLSSHLVGVRQFWLSPRLSTPQSPTTVLFRTTLTRTSYSYSWVQTIYCVTCFCGQFSRRTNNLWTFNRLFKLKYDL